MIDTTPHWRFEATLIANILWVLEMAYVQGNERARMLILGSFQQ